MKLLEIITIAICYQPSLQIVDVILFLDLDDLGCNQGLDLRQEAFAKIVVGSENKQINSLFLTRSMISSCNSRRIM